MLVYISSLLCIITKQVTIWRWKVWLYTAPWQYAAVVYDYVCSAISISTSTLKQVGTFWVCSMYKLLQVFTKWCVCVYAWVRWGWGSIISNCSKIKGRSFVLVLHNNFFGIICEYGFVNISSEQHTPKVSAHECMSVTWVLRVLNSIFISASSVQDRFRLSILQFGLSCWSS